MQNSRSYRVDGELGRFEFPTYRVVQADGLVYDTAREVFAPLGCWERYETIGFKELAFMQGLTERSSRKTADWLNRIRHHPGATVSTTLRTSAEREGQQVLACLERTTTAILHDAGFDTTGQPLRAVPLGRQDPVMISGEAVNDAITACDLPADERAEVEQNPVCYEQPTETVNISIDDVVVKQQKRHRIRRDEPDDRDEEATHGRKYVHNTVAHVQHQQQTYCLTGQGVPAVLRMVLGYLLANVLLGARLQFFVDGQKTLQAAILRAFSWCRNVGIILDWYHLEEKCKQQLSSAKMGKHQRNDVLATLTRCLWYGRVASAIAYLQGLPDQTMQNPDAIRILIGYVERNCPYIPCYAVRKRLGLRNSSNIGEKMNDLLVSDRQKHNGMSWSVSGSSALAALEALKRNKTSQSWLEYHEIPLKRVA